MRQLIGCPFPIVPARIRLIIRYLSFVSPLFRFISSFTFYSYFITFYYLYCYLTRFFPVCDLNCILLNRTYSSFLIICFPYTYIFAYLYLFPFQYHSLFNLSLQRVFHRAFPHRSVFPLPLFLNLPPEGNSLILPRPRDFRRFSSNKSANNVIEGLRYFTCHCLLFLVLTVCCAVRRHVIPAIVLWSLSCFVFCCVLLSVVFCFRSCFVS